MKSVIAHFTLRYQFDQVFVFVSQCIEEGIIFLLVIKKRGHLPRTSLYEFVSVFNLYMKSAKDR